MKTIHTIHRCFSPLVRDTDYFAGILSNVTFESRLPSGDWAPYLPDFDAQKHNGIETDACVPFSAVESIEAQINYLKKTGQLPQPHIDALTALGFFDENGNFEASERFVAKLDGTGMQGTSLPAPWDAVRKYGLIPYKDWSFDNSVLTFEQFYKPILQPLLDKGKEFLKYFDIQYEFIVQNGTGTPVHLLQKHLTQAPLCIGVAVCQPWNDTQPPTCPSTSPQHSVMVYRCDTSTHFLDHYIPFEKMFDLHYNILFALKGIVTVKKLPTPIILPAPVLPPNPTTPQISNWLDQLIAWLTGILKGRNFQGTTMPNYSLLKSRTFWTLVVMFAYNGFAAISSQLSPDLTLIVNFVLGSFATYFHISPSQNYSVSNPPAVPPQA